LSTRNVRLFSEIIFLVSFSLLLLVRRTSSRQIHSPLFEEECDLPAHVTGSALLQRFACFLYWEGVL
jgi:hypothetical protein